MAVDRPTFSESWYRVEGLHPRLRSMVQVHRQHYRGKLWYVLRDPSNNQFFRVDDAAYHFVGLLDGQRSVAEVWDMANEYLGDRAPTQGEAIQLLGQLYTSNLLHADLPADAEGMFERYRKRMRRQVGGYMMNLMFARIPLFDPDRLLDRWVGVFGPVFSPVGAALWMILIGCGLWSLAGKTDLLFNQAANILNPANVVWLSLCFVGIKAFHEFGHGIACKRFGLREQVSGEIHTVGIMLLVLFPVPYVDASSSWAFRSSWRRAVVGAAGMYVELATAAVAALVWGRTASPIAYNIIFIAGVSTLLFNGNPLLRFDGYYILSDLLEIPNLNQRSREYLYYLVKRYVYGVRKPRDPSHGRTERFWLTTFAVLSTTYRIFIAVGIILFVYYQLFFFGALLATTAIVGWVFVPLGKFAHYLLNHAELSRVRGRALLATGVFVAAVVVAVGLIRMPDRGRAEGLVEPWRRATIYMGSDGFVQEALPSRTRAEPNGRPLVQGRNVELDLKRKGRQALRRQIEARYRWARTEEQAEAQRLAEELAALDQDLARINEQIKNLRIDPPFSGTWIAMDIDRLLGAFLRRGEPLGEMATLDDLIIRVTAPQQLGPRIEPQINQDQRVEIRVRGEPTLWHTGTIKQFLPAARKRLPSSALGFAAGGSLAVSPDDPSGHDTTERFFELLVLPDPAAPDVPPLVAGQRVVVRFEMPSKPLVQQGWRALQRVIQRRGQG